ncbi:MAG: hypothetical protein A2Z72_00975 [Omnitrophica bacterium RBG_13_46_9]|nr:MAG: hypothetical protein A2Z72_00975 [Omnitrophica bacterium RBG_13_46_9]
MNKKIFRIVNVLLLITFTSAYSFGQEGFWLLQDEGTELGIQTDFKSLYDILKGKRLGFSYDDFSEWVSKKRENFVERHFLTEPINEKSIVLEKKPIFMPVPDAQDKVINTAITDLARRLRVPEGEIDNNYPIIIEGGVRSVYKVTLKHQYYLYRILNGANTEGAITPQPYGTYTYYVRVNGPIYRDDGMAIEIVGVPKYQILKLEYFDGSYDTYHYNQYYMIDRIEQYDNAGSHKATIQYLKPDWTQGVFPQTRIDTVVHYETIDGVKRVKYVDRYEYLAWQSQGGTGSGSVIIVKRYRGDVYIEGAQPLCIFCYEGQPGLEKLVRCTFADGTLITYSDNLAREVFAKGANTEQPIMRFRYEMDKYGNILSTTVIYADGRSAEFKGLADPVDIVVGYMGEIDELIGIAEKFLKETFNPDKLELIDWRIQNGILRAAFSIGGDYGMVINITVDMNTGAPNMNEALKDVALKTREDIARRTGVDMGEVHINGISPALAICYTNYGATAYMVSARVDNYTLMLEYKKYDYPRIYGELQDESKTMFFYPYPPYGPPASPVVTLKSFVDERTGRDYVKEAQEGILALFNPESSDIAVNYWRMSDGTLTLNMLLHNSEYPFGLYVAGRDIPVNVNLETGEIKIKEQIVEAVKHTRLEVSESLDLAYDDVHVNEVTRGMPVFILNTIEPYIPEEFYFLIVSTPQFKLALKCTTGNDEYGDNKIHLELTSLTNRETGVDLVRITKEDMVDRFKDIEYRAIHIEEFSVEDNSTEGRSVARFSIDVEGSEAKYIYRLDSATGEILSILIGIRMLDKEVLFDVTDKLISVEELIEKMKQLEEKKMGTENIDSETLQRKAIGDEVQRQANNPLFSKEMAGVNEEIPPVQK